MWAIFSAKIQRKIAGTLSVRQMARFSLVSKMHRADRLSDWIIRIDSDFIFNLRESQTLETEQSLWSATEFLRHLLFRTVRADSFKIRVLEVGFGFGFRSVSWSPDCIENILEPLSIVSTSHLSTVRIFWDALTSPILASFVKSLKYCKNLQEFTIFEANISRTLLDGVLAFRSTRMHTFGFPRSSFSGDEFTSESALRAIESLIRKFSPTIERLSLPGYGKCRFNFALILRELGPLLPNLVAIDLPNFCCEHPIFANFAKNYSETPQRRPYMEILPIVRKFYNLPQLISFTVHSKCLITETIKHDSLANLYPTFLTHTPLAFHTMRHEWLLTESSRDTLVPLLSMMMNEISLKSDKSGVKYILDSWASICHAGAFAREISRQNVVECFLMGLCTPSIVSDELYEWIVDYLSSNKFLYRALLPRGPTALLRIVGNSSSSLKERYRRMRLAHFIARNPSIFRHLAVDWHARDAAGNNILHLIEDKSVNLAICAIETGEVDYHIRNHAGELAHLATLLYSLYTGDYAGIYLVLGDTNQGILVHWNDLLDIYTRLPSHIRDLHFDMTDLVNIALEVLEDQMDDFPSTVYSEYRRIRIEAEPTTISQKFKNFLKEWETLLFEPTANGGAEADADADVDVTMMDDDEYDEIEGKIDKETVELILSDMRHAKYQ